MKFLIIFIDTLRPGLMNLVNPVNEVAELDNILRGMGGTVFTNCFTPAPDTPRGLACFWTGQYPSKNGCDKRIRYPRYWLNEASPNLIDLFYKKGYKINAYAKSVSIKVGIFPDNLSLREYPNVQNFVNEINISDDSLTFITLNDYCDGLGAYQASAKGVKKGKDKVADALKIIFQKFSKDDFDYIILFSDHGHKTLAERSESAHKLLNRDRTNCFAMIRKKGENDIAINDKLCSILDFYPTIVESVENQINELDLDGISLFSKKEHDFVVIEDHNYFSPEVNQIIDRWAVVSKKDVYYRELKGWCSSSKDMIEMDEVIARRSEFFRIAQKEEEILKYYTESNLFKTYSDGEQVIEQKTIASILIKTLNSSKYFKKIIKKILGKK